MYQQILAYKETRRMNFAWDNSFLRKHIDTNDSYNCSSWWVSKERNLLKKNQNPISYTVRKIFNTGGIIVIESMFPLSLDVPGIWTSESPWSSVIDGSQYSFKLKYSISFLEISSKERKDSVIFKQDGCFSWFCG